MVFAQVKNQAGSHEQSSRSSQTDLSFRLNTVSLTGEGLCVLLEMSNQTSYRKIDVPSDFSPVLSDEYGNVYRLRDTGQPSSDMSLYPGQTLSLPIRFEPPVDEASSLSLKVYINDRLASEIPIQRSQWDPDNDMQTPVFHIAYPREAGAYHSGENMFLKLGFPADQPKPRRIHILMGDYILTDSDAVGRYELRVPSDSGKTLEIIVIAEYLVNSKALTSSQTLNLKIIHETS
ncbi:MAG: hypothetical protein ACLFPX_01715 [Candidatus Omnitrophota bacterium]